MKFSTLACVMLALLWISLRVQAQVQAPPEDYEYLRRMKVPDAVVNCVAALDQWVHGAPRYDSLMVPDRRALTAKVESPVPAGALPDGASSPVPQASPIDTLIHLRGFAKLRGKYAWVPVKATCGIWHTHVVDVALTPHGTHGGDSPIH
ncbi:hypothetical protein FHX57_005525 [Paraburkholderia tropica]|uniref:BspC domain-containing protein n=1 Tax=Paraburkholderia tropica TaxID=92647 RepID=UPI0017F89EBF|nr:hypothetical protein [Paraburkholderia tropica]MBB3003151.1 hypothetical protein [Paraburkholderia tropica]MBB6322168.1 hypothetical protein [Paraburkholderia tropica]